DVNEIERIGGELETILKQVPGTRSVYAERVAGGYFLDFVLKREALARYGLTIDDANAVVMSAVGGQETTTTIQGRQRSSVVVRYPRELRDTPARLERALVTLPGGSQVPIAQLADIKLTTGPAMIRDENALLAGYVFIDFDTAARDVGGYVSDAKRAVTAKLP